MAPPKKKASVADDGNQAANELPSAEKIARLLALIATRDMSTDVAAMKLLGVGFTPREIAGLLGVGDNYVHVVKNRRKKAGKHTQEKT